ncbi:MAG: hypothetical protein AB7J28_15260 [Hyphomonadaceae bacterium]
MPRKNDRREGEDRKRRLADLGEDALWKKKRAANDARGEQRDAKQAREEKP